MKTIKKLLIIVLLGAIFNGCAVKNSDSLAVKTAKHTANSPLYVVAGVGMVATLAVQGVLIGGAKLLGVEPTKKNDINNTELNKVDTEK